jgi:hypothetical protein
MTTEVPKFRVGRDHPGQYFWFEEPPGFSVAEKWASYQVPPDVALHGPFAAPGECSENFGQATNINYEN